MNIEPGRKLLHFTLAEKIGEGGMGVVWKAVDTTLGRDVAIKILPEGFAAEAERLGRFEREAKLLASLNHPNIAGIYGIHQSEGHYFLSMEMIAGEDLAQRLSRGALPRAEALRLALQIAQAFEAAHEQGVIHRDLKPANVKLTPGGQIKVLDFGLAKALSQDASGPGASPSMSPTLTSTGTIAGTLLGTAAYMSPEQAKGKTVDKRADIWSFGVLLYEMLTGRRLFEGETISETLAAVILKEIDFGGLPGDTPEAIRRLLERCLERNPDSRLRDIGEARVRLQETLNAPAGSVVAAPAVARQPAGRFPILPWAVAAVALVALGWVSLTGDEQVETAPVMRFSMAIAKDQPLDTSPIPMLAISRDGTKIAYVGRQDNEDVIYVRHAHQLEATALKGTEDVDYPFFSPDGQWIGFQADDKLKKISILGGPPTTLCAAPRLRGATWGTDGTIVFTPDRSGGLWRVSEAGGDPEALTLDEMSDDGLNIPSHRWPDFLPGDRRVIFTASQDNTNYQDAEIQLLNLDDMSVTTLVKGGAFGRFVAPGFLVFGRQATLFAARFDPETLELAEPAVPVLENVAGAGSYGSMQLASSDAGTLIYLTGSANFGTESLIWLDRDGTETPASSHALNYGFATLSPDGRHIALEIVQPTDQVSDLWLLELERDTLTRLTYNETNDFDPIWHPDGEWITFSSVRDGASVPGIFRLRADGTGDVETLTSIANVPQLAQSWSPDGTILAYWADGSETGRDVMLLRPGADPEIEPFVQTQFDEIFPQISPDGRWVAYASNQSGRSEIYVRSLTGGGRQVKVSTDGAPVARWHPGADELLYRSLNGKLMSVRFNTEGDRFLPELPKELFDFPYPPHSFPFDVAPDGRILSYKDQNSNVDRREPVVVVNWNDELEAKVPK